VCDYFNFLESLNLGYNKKRVVESFGECWRIGVAKLDPKNKKTLVTSYKFKLKLHISNKY
jgi:hypothetical protein